MPSLFENAVASIRMGIEDFRQQDADRDISSVRNFYAGVLLLAKEALIRAAPNADPSLIIGAKIKPIPDGAGGIKMEQVGHSTIDFQQIADRAKDFGVNIDQGVLRALNKIRNDMEHHYMNESAASIRAAISKGFPLVVSLFRQLDEDPLSLLGDMWAVMLETKELYDLELAASRSTIAPIQWFSGSILDEHIKCPFCGSELVEQEDPNNARQDFAHLRCRTCGERVETADAIEKAVEDIYGGDTYIRYKDSFESGPVYECPVCNRAALIEGEGSCACCDEPLDYESECARCGDGISIQDYLDGLDEGLCSYCSYISEKVMRE
ncbi:hypothetical protein Sphch_2408 [Sphingobium chlorophenolicum L-1]|uniref:Uncharacterized protein n=1 Tax=Sphingobium chlorophenolicum L-1 TaxID=690566 RepID=F6EYB6_SPHCR|nr:hypothetical protein [Sphingobium chlorophenolicum]AEG50069.1 hypothetical protein Sphch_2408 [Sphingobium chlorophenolicum L-1]